MTTTVIGRAVDDTPVTDYRYGEDYPDTADLCFEVAIVADRVMVCVRPAGHADTRSYWNRDHREDHGYVRLHRDPDRTIHTDAAEHDARGGP